MSWCYDLHPKSINHFSSIRRVPTGQGKLVNVREFVLLGKCQGILFLKSRGK